MSFDMYFEVASSRKHFVTCWARIPFLVLWIMIKWDLHLWSNQIADHCFNILIVLLDMSARLILKLGDTFISKCFHPNQFSNIYLLIRNLPYY